MKTKSKAEIAKDKLQQYGLKALTDRELLDIVKWIGDTPSFYDSYFFKAAKELTERRERPEKIQILDSRGAAKLFTHLQDLQHEEFWAAYLNRNNNLIKTMFVAKGSVSGVVTNIPLILKEALNVSASSIIVSHNHPSENTKPSTADIDITKKLNEATKLFDMRLLEHIIICGDKYFSFADEGLIY